MTRGEREQLIRLLDVLEEAARKIRSLEAEAQKALFGKDDSETYRRKLEEKASLLMELPELAEPFLPEMERESAEEIQTGLENFARRAGQAMDLSSIFYMSALLYPEEYREGDKNDLERFITRLRRKSPG